MRLGLDRSSTTLTHARHSLLVFLATAIWGFITAAPAEAQAPPASAAPATVPAQPPPTAPAPKAQTPASAPSPHLSTRASLDWTAPFRWVHVDNIAPDRLDVFENARHGWLQALRQGDSLLADGRPLFWGHRAAERSTYFTFYPFQRFGEMDARRDAVRATQAAIAKGALELYDSGDSVLVPPHYSQIWRRSPDDDYVPAGSESLTELTGFGGLLESREPAFDGGSELDSLWTSLRTSLAAARYPIACRVYQNVYGSSTVFCLWIAPDEATLKQAPSIQELVRRQMGEERAMVLLKRLDVLFP
jgi:hypothetical protein